MSVKVSACAPQINSSDHYTCFELYELQEIAQAFNDYIKRRSVCSRETKQCALSLPITISKNKRELWRDIYTRLKYICPYEYCWVDQKFIKNIKDHNLREKIKHFTFKPKATANQHNWLSTTDINAVLRQYQRFDKHFKFLGAQPSDFYKIIKINWDEFTSQQRVAIILNFDTHKQSGSHWVTVFIDNIQRTIEYFDSVGKPPNRNIKQFIAKLRQHLDDYLYLENVRIHQKENSECGVYAIYYVIQRLLGKGFRDITENIIRDHQIAKFRKYIFRYH